MAVEPITPDTLPPYLHLFSRTLTPQPLPHFGTRYDSSGQFLREPGNTIVCHLLPGTESEQAIVDARAGYLSMPGACQLAFTPVSSLHMTLFQGIIEYRRKLPFWPADVPLDAPIDDMTAIYMDRLAAFVPDGPFEMEVTEATPAGLTLDGVTADDRARLKSWRNRFADLLGYRHPDHDRYSFHITFAYPKERFDDETIAAWVPFLDEVMQEVRARSPVIALKPPAFCAFEDMNHFEELLVFEPA